MMHFFLLGLFLKIPYFTSRFYVDDEFSLKFNISPFKAS